MYSLIEINHCKNKVKVIGDAGQAEYPVSAAVQLIGDPETDDEVKLTFENNVVVKIERV